MTTLIMIMMMMKTVMLKTIILKYRNYIYDNSHNNIDDDDVDDDSAVGVPSVEDWPQEVALPQSAFSPRPPQQIGDLVPDMDDVGRSLLLVSGRPHYPTEISLE